jgi:hypothetical protein
VVVAQLALYEDPVTLLELPGVGPEVAEDNDVVGASATSSHRGSYFCADMPCLVWIQQSIQST